MTLLPPGAEPLTERGAFEIAVRHCADRLLVDLGAGSGKHPATTTWSLPATTDWPAVLETYAALPDGWRQVPAPEQQYGYRLARWEHRRPLRTDNLAVALLDEPVTGGAPLPFRLLVVATEPA